MRRTNGKQNKRKAARCRKLRRAFLYRQSQISHEKPLDVSQSFLYNMALEYTRLRRLNGG